MVRRAWWGVFVGVEGCDVVWGRSGESSQPRCWWSGRGAFARAELFTSWLMTAKMGFRGWKRSSKQFQ